MAHLLQINSSSRASGSTQKCVFHLDRPIGGTYQLVGCQVPYMQPPVDSRANSYNIQHIDNSLPYDYFGEQSGTQPAVTLLSPVYTPQNVADALATYLNIVHGNVFTATLNDSNHIVLSRTDSVRYTFHAHSSGIATTNTDNHPFISLADVFGVSSQVNMGTSTASVTFPSPVNLAQTLSYHVNINNDSQVETTDGNRSTFVIPINVNSFEVQNYNVNENPRQIVSFRNHTKVLEIEWLTGTNQVLTEHVTWNILLEKV